MSSAFQSQRHDNFTKMLARTQKILYAKSVTAAVEVGSPNSLNEIVFYRMTKYPKIPSKYNNPHFGKVYVITEEQTAAICKILGIEEDPFEDIKPDIEEPVETKDESSDSGDVEVVEDDNAIWTLARPAQKK